MTSGSVSGSGAYPGMAFSVSLVKRRSKAVRKDVDGSTGGTRSIRDKSSRVALRYDDKVGRLAVGSDLHG
jgi:hypothetical protein